MARPYNFYAQHRASSGDNIHYDARKYARDGKADLSAVVLPEKTTPANEAFPSPMVYHSLAGFSWEALSDKFGPQECEADADWNRYVKRVEGKLSKGQIDAIKPTCAACGKPAAGARGMVLTRSAVYCKKCYAPDQHGAVATVTRKIDANGNEVIIEGA
jgi:hypothetical protein